MTSARRRNWRWIGTELLSALFLIGLVVLIWILFVVVRP